MDSIAVDKYSRKIALLISIYFPPEPGGGSSAARNRALILDKIGYCVYVLCGFPSYPSGNVTDPKYRGKLFYVEEQENFTLIRLRLLPLKTSGYLKHLILFVNFVLLSLFFMFRILKTIGKIELVYAIAPIIFSSFIGFVYSRISKSFLIYEVSDLWPEELVVFRTHLWFIIFPVGRVLAKFSYIFPDIIVAISQLAAEHVTKSYKPKAPVHVLPIGVDIDKFQTKSKEQSRKTLIDTNLLPSPFLDKFIILYSGLISEATRVDNLVHAAGKLQHNDNEIVFFIVGEGEEKQKLEELKSANNINNLFMLPFQSRDLIPTIISASDVCVVSLPSDPIFGVDVPTKFYEYLACNKPQIGICEGDLANLINSRNLGFTVKDGQIDELAKVIVTLKSSPALINAMEKNSQSVLQEFSLDTLAAKFSTVVENEMKKRENQFKI